MQPEYLDRLGPSVRGFVLEIEQRASIDIQVVPDPRLNRGGPFGRGHLEVLIEDRRNFILAPTNGYFPDGAVRHELLHLKRFHVDGVPKLAVATGARSLSPSALGHLDNAIEHIVFVPWELRFHPERREHWEAVLQDVCEHLPSVPEQELRLAITMHWTFLRHVLPGSRQAEIAKSFGTQHGLFADADRFADQFLAATENKEHLVRLLFQTFSEIPRDQAALEYVSSKTGTIQRPIP